MLHLNNISNTHSNMGRIAVAIAISMLLPHTSQSQNQIYFLDDNFIINNQTISDVSPPQDYNNYQPLHTIYGYHDIIIEHQFDLYNNHHMNEKIITTHEYNNAPISGNDITNSSDEDGQTRYLFFYNY